VHHLADLLIGPFRLLLLNLIVTSSLNLKAYTHNRLSILWQRWLLSLLLLYSLLMGAMWTHPPFLKHNISRRLLSLLHLALLRYLLTASLAHTLRGFLLKHKVLVLLFLL